MLEIVDREAEGARLRELADSGVPRLALVYGRRRIGKTYLLSNLWDRRRVFYFTASVTTPEQNRRHLIREAARWSNSELRPEDYPTWRTAFGMLLNLRAPDPVVLVIDEFQYLGKDLEDLVVVTSELNAAWETRRPDRSLLFVISGSSTRTLEALDAGGAPLHGRLAWKARLDPFDYRDAGRMVPYRDLRTRACAYGVFGGVPHYLAAVDVGRPLAENIAQLMLSPRGEVRGQVETAILQEQGLREIPKYRAILAAVGAGRTALNEIAGRAGLPNDTSLRRMVERLVSLGYVAKRRNLGAKRTELYRYGVEDPAFRFYYEMVAPRESMLEIHDPRSVWTELLEGRLDTYMGHVFESMVQQAYRRLREPRGLPLVEEWSRWEGLDREGAPLEVDIAVRLADGRVLTGEVKWSRSPLDVRVHFDHLAKIERLAAAGVGWAHRAREGESPLLYVAAGGFSEAFVSAARPSREAVYLWTLEDFYAPDSEGR
ncbi:MAG: ATP-binding protein [Gemmatimonadota bacterium]